MAVAVEVALPIAFQLEPGLGLTVPPPVRAFPFMSQIEAWPLFAFCHRMSERLSPLKSPSGVSVTTSVVYPYIYGELDRARRGSV